MLSEGSSMPGFASVKSSAPEWSRAICRCTPTCFFFRPALLSICFSAEQRAFAIQRCAYRRAAFCNRIVRAIGGVRDHDRDYRIWAGGAVDRVGNPFHSGEARGPRISCGSGSAAPARIAPQAILPRCERKQNDWLATRRNAV